MNRELEDFSKQLVCIAQELGANFSLRGERIAPEKVFSSTGLLPPIMRRADQLCTFCLGYGLGLTFSSSSGSMTGSSIDLDAKVSSSLRLLCVTDVLVEMLQNSADNKTIVLDEMMLDGGME
jgi:intracellular multiplication protein IcmS